MPVFEHDGLRLHYAERGSGRPLVLVHGLLWSARMFERLSQFLPDDRLLLLDLRGHGKSERPPDASSYSWGAMASDVVALLDHLGIERAVVGGLSLGADVALVTAFDYPDRCAGLVVEMPVLQGARDFAIALFGLLATGLEAGRAPLDVVAPFVRRIPVPGSIPEIAAFRDMAALEPRSSAALIRGLIADADRLNDLEHAGSLKMPALVIGHRFDPVHLLDDARELAAGLPDARLVVASSQFEFRFHPGRLARHMRELLDDAWAVR